jgi:diaminopimelate epimerase
MRIYNSDGSTAEMCGNGLRCVASFISSRGLRHPRRARGGDVWVQTGAGLRRCGILPGGDVRVSLGTPQILDVASPLAVPTPSALLLQRWSSSTESWDAQVGAGAGAGVAASREFPVTGISVGNPHCVVFEDDFAEEEKEEGEKEGGGVETGEPCAAGGHAATTTRKRTRRERTNGKSSMPIENLPLWGPQLEWHEAFPEGVNTEFVRILDAGNFEMRTWERGSGETLACGTGAGAAAAACMLTGRTALRSLTAHLRGGQLRIDWEEDSEGGGGGVGGGGGGVEGVGGVEGGTAGGTVGGSRAVAAVEAGRGELFIQGPAREICSGELLFPLLADS